MWAIFELLLKSSSAYWVRTHLKYRHSLSRWDSTISLCQPPLTRKNISRKAVTRVLWKCIGHMIRQQDSIASTPKTSTLIAYCIYFCTRKALASHSICKTCFLIIYPHHSISSKHQNHEIWLILDQKSWKITAKGVTKFLLFLL